MTPDMPKEFHDLDRRWRRELADLESQGRLRRLQIPGGVDFSSNDYLGLGREELPTAPYPVSGQASRLLRGHHGAWEEVEERLAAWHGAEAALVFTSGYSANEGLLGTVLRPGDVVLSDALNHASIIDGLRLTRSGKRIFRHNDLNHLQELLRASTGNLSRDQAVLIVTESLFGMEGDRAPLQDIAGLAERYGAHLIVDEAHATGCFGPEGAGLVDDLGLRSRVLATVHTGGKGLGLCGAYVCVSRLLKDVLVNRCRHLIFTTALPPAVARWWLQRLPEVRTAADRRRRLAENARFFREALQRHGLSVGGTDQIVPILLGEDEAAVQAARQVRHAGFDMRAIRPPSVPEGTARLRVCIHAPHEAETLRRAAAAIAEAVSAT